MPGIPTRVLLLCFFVQCLTVASQPAIEWGPVFGNRDKKTKRVWVTAEDSTNLYIVKHGYFMRAHHWYIEAINKKNKDVAFSREVPQPLGENKKPTEFFSFITLDNKPYYLSMAEDKQAKKTTVYASSVDPKTGQMNNTRPIYSISSGDREKNVNFCFSPAGRNILFYPTPYDPEVDQMKLCDENLQTLWVGSLKFYEKVKINNQFSACIDDKQNIAVYSADAKAMSIFSTVQKKGKNISILVPNGAAVYNSILRVTPRGEFFFLSMLKPEKYEISSGFIQAFIDPQTQEPTLTNTIALDTTQLKELLGKNIGPKWREIGLYYIKDVFFRRSDYVLIGEQEYDKRTFQPVYYSSMYPSLYGNSYLGYYYYPNFSPFTIEKQLNLISIFNMSYRGDVNWVRVIPKNQAYPVDTYLSFIATCDENNVYLVYNDNAGNINARPPFGPRAMRNPKKAMGVFAEVNKAGQLRLGSFYRSRGNKRRVIKPAFCYPGTNSIYLFTESKRKACIGEFFLK